jgi:hypothetical protein
VEATQELHLEGEQSFEAVDDAELTSLVEGDQEQATVVDGEQAKAEEEPPVEGEPAPDPKVLAEKVKELEERYEKQVKSNQDKEAFIQRQANELGELRRIREKLIARKQQLEGQNWQDRFIADPQGYHRDLNEQWQVTQNLREIEAREQEQQIHAMREVNAQQIRRFAPDFENTIEDICKAALDAGEDPRSVQAFRQDPYSMHPAVGLLYYKEASYKRQIADLQTKLQELAAKPKEMLSRVEQASRQRPLAAKSGGAKWPGKHAVIDEAQIAALSDAELADLLANNQ